MVSYEEYLAQGADKITARAWADADREAEADEPVWAAKPRRLDFSGRQERPRTATTAAGLSSSVGSPPAEDPELSQALDDLQLRVGPAPAPAVGRDPTGMVGLHVDREHTPVRLELRTEWAKALSAATLAVGHFRRLQCGAGCPVSGGSSSRGLRRTATAGCGAG